MRRRIKRVLASLLLAVAAAAQETGEWQAQVRRAVESKDLDQALVLVEDRLSRSPQDLEARAWHARLLAWRGEWARAETEYRSVLAVAPNDVDVLLGLSDVLIWQDKLQEALSVLERARSLAPQQREVLLRRARLLARLNRVGEARQQYRSLLSWSAGDTEARSGLASLPDEYRHELRVGSDTDAYNFADTATAQGMILISRWNSHWTTEAAFNSYQRFGADAYLVTGRVSRKLGARDWVAAGGGAGHDEDVIAKRTAVVEYGHAFTFAKTALVRGMELTFRHQWLWYSQSQVRTFSGSALLYLPRDWMWSLTVTAARSSFPVVGIEWQPSGNTRLSFPLWVRGLRGNLGFALGTENFAKVDEIGRFSARTYSGGLRYQLTRSQDIGGYFAYQNRSQQRTQTSFGLTYGIRF